MGRFIVSRLIIAVFVAITVSVIGFSLLRPVDGVREGSRNAHALTGCFVRRIYPGSEEMRGVWAAG